MSETDGPVQHDTQRTVVTGLFLRRTNSGIIRFDLAGGLRQAGLPTITFPIPSDLFLVFPSFSFLPAYISPSFLLSQALVMRHKLSLNP